MKLYRTLVDRMNSEEKNQLEHTGPIQCLELIPKIKYIEYKIIAWLLGGKKKPKKILRITNSVLNNGLFQALLLEVREVGRRCRTPLAVGSTAPQSNHLGSR